MLNYRSRNDSGLDVGYIDDPGIFLYALESWEWDTGMQIGLEGFPGIFLNAAESREWDLHMRLDRRERVICISACELGCMKYCCMVLVNPEQLQVAYQFERL